MKFIIDSLSKMESLMFKQMASYTHFIYLMTLSMIQTYSVHGSFG
jgi:hypothetical protein